MFIDHYGDFASGEKSCKHCPWKGKAADMTSGDSFGDGVEKHCPDCGTYYGFVQWSVIVSNNPPSGWEANIGRVAY
jgi:hypothetical protein